VTGADGHTHLIVSWIVALLSPSFEDRVDLTGKMHCTIGAVIRVKLSWLVAGCQYVYLLLEKGVCAVLCC